MSPNAPRRTSAAPKLRIHGTGAQNFSRAMRYGCSVVSGSRFAPERAPLAPKLDPVADVVEANDLFLGMVSLT